MRCMGARRCHYLPPQRRTLNFAGPCHHLPETQSDRADAANAHPDNAADQKVVRMRIEPTKRFDRVIQLGADLRSALKRLRSLAGHRWR